MQLAKPDPIYPFIPDPIYPELERDPIKQGRAIPQAKCRAPTARSSGAR